MNFLLNSWFYNTNIFEKNLLNISNSIYIGKVLSVHSLIIEVTGIYSSIGEYCWVECFYKGIQSTIICKVMGFKKKIFFLIPIQNSYGIFPGAKVFSENYIFNKDIKFQYFPFGSKLLGRVLNGFGHPLDNLGDLNLKKKLFNFFKKKPINPLNRKPITEILDTGVCAINSLLTVGRGQRMGIFSQAGIGKSMLLGMISRHTDADIIVVSLVGERGREVKDFIDNILGKDSLKKSVVIVSSADVSPMFKIQSVEYATAVAEYFCNKGNNVLLIVDSLTRYAMAYREVSNSLYEIPVLKGYPASIFSNIPYLIERTGNIDNKSGSITSFYTILTEGDEYNDPILDITKSVLDGHIILSNVLSESGHYPAINIEKSISRLMSSIVDHDHYQYSIYIKKLISCYYKNYDIINLGVYTSGKNKLLDQAITLWPFLEKFLQQKFLDCCTYNQSILKLKNLLKII